MNSNNNFYEGKEVVTNGAIGDMAGEYKREDVLLQRNISDGGDTVTITLYDQDKNTIVYMVPSESLKEILG
ncbi:hypothetical protein [Vallitalea guaymasensis]|uniref:hypothetical protein n=1 Tax=Vallitalea guaymasensis TaxID=1185412 RepID=UPI000DE37605|nr:hypothetical protein [Vallitalea guaymasensis]